MPKKIVHPWSRRKALKGLGAVATLPLVGCGTESMQPVIPVVPPEGIDALRARVDTVVVVMMENRSFDHYFGALTLEEGRTDVDGLTPEMSNPHPDGSQVVSFPAEISCIEDPPHSWSTSHAQWNEGANDGFVEQMEARHSSMGAHAMGYWGRQTLSTLYTLADHGALCDAWFASLMTSTWPNRYYSHCGQNGGVFGNDLPADSFDSIYTLLEAAGRSWKSYYSNLPFMVMLPDVPLADPRLMGIENFFSDAAEGTLPNFSIVEPTFGRNDDHPPCHPVAGQVFLSSIYDALATSPQWERTALIITYDEHGGFYDHVNPPTAPDTYASDGFDQLGFRVPTVVAGPWVKPGHVGKTVYDHTSILAFLSQLYDLPGLTKRSRAADPLDDLFDFDALSANLPMDPVALPEITVDPAILYAEGCLWDAIFRSGGPHTGQSELEAYLRKVHAGTRLNRTSETDEIYEWQLALAERRGLLRRG